jgi:hypothetical protein
VHDQKLDNDGDTGTPGQVPTIRVQLIPSAAMNQPAKPHVEQSQLQDGIQKMLSRLDGKDAAKPEELKKLSESVAALAANSMNFATVAGYILPKPP